MALKFRYCSGIINGTKLSQFKRGGDNFPVGCKVSIAIRSAGSFQVKVAISPMERLVAYHFYQPQGWWSVTCWWSHASGKQQAKQDNMSKPKCTDRQRKLLLPNPKHSLQPASLASCMRDACIAGNILRGLYLGWLHVGVGYNSVSRLPLEGTMCRGPALQLRNDYFLPRKPHFRQARAHGTWRGPSIPRRYWQWLCAVSLALPVRMVPCSRGWSCAIIVGHLRNQLVRR